MNSVPRTSDHTSIKQDADPNPDPTTRELKRTAAYALARRPPIFQTSQPPMNAREPFAQTEAAWRIVLNEIR
jgi:hypothetical protein